MSGSQESGSEPRRRLAVLCAGAVKGLVESLGAQWAETSLHARFGAVGAMRDALRGGSACDVLIVTDTMAMALEASGELLPGSRASIGRVATGIAVPGGTPQPAIGDGDTLAASLGKASALYFPDAERSTAGAHFVAVLDKLRIRDRLAPRFRMFPNGATAMRELAASREPAAIGCTQVTEIRYTAGIDLVGVLPRGYELATVYSAGIANGATEEAAARRFIALLAGSETLALRRAGGFEIAGVR